MNLLIKNLYKIREANLSFPTGATLITGRNSAGKTSVSNILKAVLSQDPNPSGLPATQYQRYIRKGASEGSAELKFGEDDYVVWDPLGKGNITSGVVPHSSPYCVGGVDFCKSEMKKELRAAKWEKLLIPNDDPKALLKSHWVNSSKELNVIVDTILASGWKEAKNIYESLRKDHKSRWATITGEPRYGAAKAGKWVPERWSPDLAGESEESLQAELVNARDTLQSLQAVRAVSLSEIEKAAHLRDRMIPAFKSELEGIHNKFRTINSELESVKVKWRESGKKLDEMILWVENASIKLNNITQYQCPNCETGFNIEYGEVIVPDELPEDKRSELQEKFETNKAIMDKFEKKRETLQLSMSELTSKRNELERDITYKRIELESMEKQVHLADSEQVDAADEQEISHAEKNVREAEIRLNSFRTYYLALEQHESVVRMDSVCDLLGPNGVRSKVMMENIGRLRKVLEKINDITRWLPIEIDDDYQITSGGWPIQLCADNEKLKTQWAFQIACAAITKSSVVVLDKADALRDESWDGMILLIERLCDINKSLRIIVCATSSDIKNWNRIELQD